MSKLKYSLIFLLVFLLFLIDVSVGKVDITMAELYSLIFNGDGSELHRLIFFESRLPQALTAIAAGVGLSLSGLAMQAYFRNALAGPSVLGISSGASLGVALVIMLSAFFGLSAAYSGVVVLAAFLGSMAALFLILIVSRVLRDATALLIFGMMLGFVSGAVVSTLQFGAAKEALRSFVFWGLGSFSQVQWDGIVLLYSSILLGLALLLYILPSLNALMLGDADARSIGIKVKGQRNILLVSTGIMTASVTAFCGPIAFIGLAVPHLARGLWNSSDHRKLLPGVILIGALLGLLADVVSRMPFADWSLPVNTVTSLIGAPVVMYIIMKQRKQSQML